MTVIVAFGPVDALTWKLPGPVPEAGVTVTFVWFDAAVHATAALPLKPTVIVWGLVAPLPTVKFRVVGLSDMVTVVTFT